MESAKPILTADGFRALAQKEDGALLGKLVELGQKRDFPGLRPFLEYLEADGFSASFALRNNPMGAVPDKKKPVLPIGSVQRKSFGHALLTSITPMPAVGAQVPAEMDLGDRGNAFLDRFLSVLSKQPETIRQTWLNTLLRDACDAVASQGAVAKILAAGAEPEAHLQTRHPRLDNQTQTIACEALLRTNIPAAAAMASQAPANVVRTMARAIVEGHEATGLNPERIYPEAQAIADGAAGHGRPPWALLDTMSDRLSIDAMVPVRRRVLTHHLRQSLLDQKDWSEEAVQGLVGKRGSPERSALTQAIAAEWRAEHDRSFPLPVFGQRPWRDLMKMALAVHCSEVLEMFPDMLRHDAKRKKSNSAMQASPDPVTMGDAIVTTATVQPGSPFQPARFARTLDLMVEHGFSLDKIAGQPAAVFLAAKNPSHILGKLVVLLDKQIDVSACDASGRTAGMIVPVPLKPRWDHVVNTHHARARAHGLLNEMDQARPAP